MRSKFSDKSRDPPVSLEQRQCRFIAPRWKHGMHIDLDEVGSRIVESIICKRTMTARSYNLSCRLAIFRTGFAFRTNIFARPNGLLSHRKPVANSAKAKSKLDDDAIADISVSIFQRLLRVNSKVRIAPKAADLRVVTAQPGLRTSLDLEEVWQGVIIGLSYRSGTADIPHAELRHGNCYKKYFRAGSTFHRADWDLL